MNFVSEFQARHRMTRMWCVALLLAGCYYTCKEQDRGVVHAQTKPTTQIRDVEIMFAATPGLSWPLQWTPRADTLMVYRNGLLQAPMNDYVLLGTSTVQFLSASKPLHNDTLQFIYYAQ